MHTCHIESVCVLGPEIILSQERKSVTAADANRFLVPAGTAAYIGEYANRIPNPKHTPEYTKAKVPPTQAKHTST